MILCSTIKFFLCLQNITTNGTLPRRKKSSGEIAVNKKYSHISLYGFRFWNNFQINHTIEWRQVEDSFYLYGETH